MSYSNLAGIGISLVSGSTRTVLGGFSVDELLALYGLSAGTRGEIERLQSHVNPLANFARANFHNNPEVHSLLPDITPEGRRSVEWMLSKERALPGDVPDGRGYFLWLTAEVIPRLAPLVRDLLALYGEVRKASRSMGHLESDDQALMSLLKRGRNELSCMYSAGTATMTVNELEINPLFDPCKATAGRWDKALRDTLLGASEEGGLQTWEVFFRCVTELKPMAQSRAGREFTRSLVYIGRIADGLCCVFSFLDRMHHDAQRLAVFTTIVQQGRGLPVEAGGLVWQAAMQRGWGPSGAPPAGASVARPPGGS